MATAIVGITIYRKQRSADKRVHDFIEEQHQIILHEDKRKKSIKRYYIRRAVKSDFDRVDKHYKDLKQHIHQHLENKSEESWTSLKRYIDFYILIVDGFITVTEDIKTIADLLDNPRLRDKHTLILFHGGELKGYAKELGEYQNRDNEDIIDIEESMDSVMNYIYEFKDMLMEEVDNKLD